MAKVLSDHSVLTVSKAQLSSDLADEAVILDLKGGIYYGLNPVGVRVWNLLKKAPCSVGEIREVLLDEFDTSPEQCSRDLKALLKSLVDAGLIEVRTAR